MADSNAQKRTKTLEEKIDYFLSSLDRTYPSTGRLMWRSFLMGIFTALGATIGLSIVVAVATYIFTQARTVPGVKDVIRETQIDQVLPKK